MLEQELIAALRLQAIPNIGAIKAKKLIAYCGSAQNVFERTTDLSKIKGIGRQMLAQLHEQSYLELAKKELNYIQDKAIGYWYYRDANYPKLLQHCADAPILLFYNGNIDLNHKKVISIVGTRNMTKYGASFCESLISDLAPLNPVIISGFAYGVDIKAQRCAMDFGLQTIGCLAHGLNQIYPKQHAKYAKNVLQNGGFITEFWSSSSPERENFLKRNRIIAGISEATVVIESKEKGGSLVTADLAHGYHREVFACPGRATDIHSLGCNALIKHQKAHMITSAADLVYQLGWNLETQPDNGGRQHQLFEELDATEKQVYGYLQSNGKQILDSVALECKLPIFRASSILLNMEMKGVIRPLPGKLFEII